MTTPHTAIVVGISTEGSEAAVRFAVEEGRRSGRPVHLVHVLQLPAGDAYAMLYDGAVEAARTVLAAAEVQAKELAGDRVVVTSEVANSGWAVEELALHSDGEQLLVLEHRALSRLHRVLSGSVTQRVAGRAGVPVFSVPAGWTPRDDGQALVTAAVQDAAEAPALLRAAFVEARDRKSTLVVLHAWWLASGFESAVLDEVMGAEWSVRTRLELEPVLTPLRAAFPDVEVTIDVRHAPPVEAVLDAAERSDLLVIGRRHHLLPLGSHLGPVARAVLGHATTPVLITPEVEVTDADAKRSSRRGHLVGSLAPHS